MSNLVKNPYAVYTDVDGTPIDQGYIFIGESGLNPISNPLSVFWDAALTIPAQAIRTVGGYPSYNGSPGILYASAPYSILIQNKKGVTVFSSITPPTEVFDSLAVNGVVTISGTGGAQTLSVDRTLFSKGAINYLWCTTLNGYLAIGTNGRVVTVTEANIVFNADQSVSIPTELITPLATVAEVVTPLVTADTVVTPTVEESAAGEGVSIQAEGAGQLKTKVLEIGDWDMDTLATVQVAHGLVDWEGIRSVGILIRRDDAALTTRLTHSIFPDGHTNGTWTLDATNINLIREAAGYYDDTDFDSNAFNRGWVTIVYEV